MAADLLAQLFGGLVGRTSGTPGRQVIPGVGGLHLLDAHRQRGVGIGVHQVEVVFVVVAGEGDHGSKDTAQPTGGTDEGWRRRGCVRRRLSVAMPDSTEEAHLPAQAAHLRRLGHHPLAVVNTSEGLAYPVTRDPPTTGTVHVELPSNPKRRWR